MKKITKLLLCLALLIVGTSSVMAQNLRDINFSIIKVDNFESKFYPSLALWNATLEDPTDIFYSFYLVAPEESSSVKITIEESILNYKTVIRCDADGEMVIDPIIRWKYDKFPQMSQGGVVTMTAILEIDGEEVDQLNEMVYYRPINECILGFYEGEEWCDTRWLFAMYVNEDYPAIDKVLQEILAEDRDRQFIDYQGEAQDFLNQIVWVWKYFSDRGTRYSNVVNTSNVSDYVGSQYVRFIDQSLNNVQANCVDGSVLLASIYRKIGLDVDLVLVPGHCMLTINYPGDIDMGEFGRTGEDGGVLLLETTLMGANTDYATSFNAAVECIPYEELARRIDEEEYLVVNIEEARANNVMPIQR